MAQNTRTLVLAAVERELAPVRALLSPSRAAGITWRLTGVGKAAAAIATARELALGPSPARVVLVGCAGAFPGSGLLPGDVVVASEEVFADDGVEAPGGFLDLAALDLPLARRGGEALHNVIPAGSPPPAALDALRARAAGRFQLRSGRLATVSTGSGTDARARAVEERWQPLAESMEGAAVALACWLEGCSLCEIRGISNLTGDRDRARWEIDTACAHAAEVAVAYLDWLEAAAP